jgi:hypothetical protein
MKHKHLFATLIAIAFTCATAEAQIYESIASTKTKIKGPSNVSWFGRVGATFSKVALGEEFQDYYTDESSMKFGYHLTVGMEKPFTRTSDFFWGVQAGLSSVGISIDSYSSSYFYDNVTGIDEWEDYSCTVPTIFIGPIIGYHKRLKDNVIFDIHFSPQVHGVLKDLDGYNGTWSERNQTTNKSDYGSCTHDFEKLSHLFSAELGVGLWINQFIVDLSYRYDYQPVWHNKDISGFNNLMLTVGYVFKQPK